MGTTPVKTKINGVWFDEAALVVILLLIKTRLSVENKMEKEMIFYIEENYEMLFYGGTIVELEEFLSITAKVNIVLEKISEIYYDSSLIGSKPYRLLESANITNLDFTINQLHWGYVFKQLTMLELLLKGYLNIDLTINERTYL